MPTRSAEADFDDFVVRVYRGAPETVSAIGVAGNAGIYLGEGLVLTAAHVSGSPGDKTPLGIAVEDRLVPARFIKAGRYEETDISLLAVDLAALPSGLRSRQAPAFCPTRLLPGQAAVVASFARIDRSSIVSYAEMPVGLPAKFDSLIRDVYSTGDSGSGVFDPIRRCLAGIISRRIEILPEKNSGKAPIGLAKYFVPADEIIAFLGAALPRGAR